MRSTISTIEDTEFSRGFEGDANIEHGIDAQKQSRAVDIPTPDSGFTLIEAVIGVVLVGIIAVGVFTPLLWSQQTIADQQVISSATNASVEALEHIRYGGSGTNMLCVDVMSRAAEVDGEVRNTRTGKPYTINVSPSSPAACNGIHDPTALDITVYATDDGEEIPGTTISAKVLVD